jgi:indole-3-glycerol phosphate synthase
MSDFLADMAEGSRARVAAARAARSEDALRACIATLPPAPAIRLSPARFDLIMELKLRSPAQGALAAPAAIDRQIGAYARAGACAVSVLTEPKRFDGALEHLASSAATLAPFAIPAMRKDFVVDRYQLLEARLAGAGGVLLIVRMLGDAGLGELLAECRALGLFALLECFDALDAARASSALAHGRPPTTLVGVNCRDLTTLALEPARLLELVDALPAGFPRVAESGLASPEDAARLARAGYQVALVGSSLMNAADPEALARALLAAGRAGSA